MKRKVLIYRRYSCEYGPNMSVTLLEEGVGRRKELHWIPFTSVSTVMKGSVVFSTLKFVVIWLFSLSPPKIEVRLVPWCDTIFILNEVWRTET